MLKPSHLHDAICVTLLTSLPVVKKILSKSISVILYISIICECGCNHVSAAEQSCLILCWKVEYKKDFERTKSQYTPVPDTVEMQRHQQNKKNLEGPRVQQRNRKSQASVVGPRFHVLPILLCLAIFPAACSLAWTKGHMGVQTPSIRLCQPSSGHCHGWLCHRPLKLVMS